MVEVYMSDTLKLPVGVDSFEKIRRNRFYYIDKTKLIEQLVEMGGEVTMFTRPRRFGKTLNMSMLRSFFEIGAALLFEGLYIAKNKSLCEALLSTNDFYDPRDFGFTDHEVKKILDDYGLTSHLKEIKEWYDGYHFGNPKPRDQESFCKEDQRVVFGCLKKRWKDTGEILQCIYQKGFQKDRTDFWRLSLEHDQYKGYSSCQRKFHQVRDCML